MKELSCVIVDDQSFSMTILKNYVKKFDELQLLDTFTDPLLAKEFITNSNGIDILFSDVDMPEISGIELAESTHSKVKHVVFVTAHFKRELAPDLDKDWYYLAKPTSLENFREVFMEIQSKS